MSFRVVIPARMASTRLPGKVLADLAGQPVLLHVASRAAASAAQAVWVATDDLRVAQVARDAGLAVAMTRPDHPSGSDRIRELIDAQQWPDDTVVVNVQGDEPQMPTALIDQVAQCLLDEPAADWATVATPLSDPVAWRDPNVVKVVIDDAGFALYFSRAPIPWDRDLGAAEGLPSQAGALRHIGLYAYRAAALRRYCASPPAALESCERLEQLRALAIGMRIRVLVTEQSPPTGVDTPEDLQRLRAALTAVDRG